jgi:hypothetical protein
MDKKEIPAKDYETGLDIAGRYAKQYLFDFYDITITRNPDNVSGSPGDMETWSKRHTINSALSFQRR